MKHAARVYTRKLSSPKFSIGDLWIPARTRIAALLTKFGSRAIAAIIAICFSTVVAAGDLCAANLRVQDASGASGLHGLQIPIVLTPEAAETISAMNFEIAYDPAKLSFRSIAQDVVTQTAEKGVYASSPQAGVVRILILGKNQNRLDSGRIALISFDITATESSQTSLSVQNPLLVNPDGQTTYPTTTTNGTVTITPAPNETIYIFVNGQRIAHEDKDGKFFYHNDHLGSSVVITDSNGLDTRFFEYAPFGKVKLETPGSAAHPDLKLKHKFNSKELDESTGLYDYEARQYDAEIARFISADPIEWTDGSLRKVDGKGLREHLIDPQNLNRYSYASNNPLKYTDSSGKKIELAQKVVKFLGMSVGMHRFFVLSPDRPSDFNGNARFVKDSKGNLTSTVGGQPERPFPNFGRLMSQPNSDLSSKIEARATISPPGNMTDSQFINSILKAEGSYKNNLSYDPTPGAGDNLYNSNSFASGIAKNVGINKLPDLGGFAPGFDKPIPLKTESVAPQKQTNKLKRKIKRRRQIFLDK
jgi:RHS repeat-associated protein